jgi:hypothetical protein
MTETPITKAGSTDSEHPDFILEYARQRGWTISRAQLERRHRAGVVGRPRQHGRGRGLGTVTIYPAGTAELLVAGLEIGGMRMPLRQLAFEMWLRGLPVPIEGVRAYLSALATLHDRLAALIRFLGFGRAALPERALRFVERIARAQAPATMRSMQRRLGSAERVETLLRTTIEMTGGVYRPPERERVLGDSDDEGRLVETALDLEKARTEAPIGLRPWLQGSASEGLVTSSRLYAGHWGRDLAVMSSADLERGRERWLQLRQFFDVIRDMREIYGGDVFGLGALANGYAAAGPIIDALAVFVIARDARGAGSLGQFGAIAEVCAQWRAQVTPHLGGLRALRAFAPTAELFSARRLRPTLIDAVAKERWEIEAGEVGLRYKTEIAGLLATGGTEAGSGRTE